MCRKPNTDTGFVAEKRFNCRTPSNEMAENFSNAPPKGWGWVYLSIRGQDITKYVS